MWRREVSIWFILLIIICIVLIGLGKTQRGIRVQLRATSFFSPFQKYASFLFNTFKIRHENKILKQKMAQLVFENQQLKMYKYENEKLKSLLEFKTQKPYKLIAAKVVGRDPDPMSGICVVDKGEDDGVEKNLPVITMDGVYGKILENRKNIAVVQTFFNFNFRVSAMDIRTGIQGIAKWESGEGCILEKVPIYSDIKVGDKIVTSGLGSVFPKGLEIGEVEKIDVDKTKLFYSIRLKPVCKFSEVEYVFIVKEMPTVSEKEAIYETPVWEIYPKEDRWIPTKFKIQEPSIRTELHE
ncbi:MAG: rod shape-determining protein MreC [bacterium]|nr:rod shape-determining protein MreC [bacterium]